GPWSAQGGDPRRGAAAAVAGRSKLRPYDFFHTLRSAETSVERRNAPAQRLHVLPDLRVLLAFLLVKRRGGRELQVRLKIPKRGREVFQVIGEQAAIAQLVDRRRIDGEQQLRDVARLGKRVH